ncbi:amino acid adenylation domain-containing protein [Roseomonas elaeocarpi]|uniref:Amino acid adenylation domain-containing protein n=1 Tax=Roseomonas elaeocarpi TaxID=907779 RepID=A0ABV6JVZ2_9PROT
MSMAAELQAPALAQPAAGAATAPEEVALTEAQLGLWVSQRLDPANPIFNTAHLILLTGPLDRRAFRDAVTQAVAEAEALSLRFRDTHAGPVQRTDPTHRPQLGTVDLSDHPEAEATARGAVARDLARPIDPARDQLAAETLFCLPPDREGRPRHLWYQRIHHLAADAFAHDLIARRTARLYEAQLTGAAPGAPLTPFRNAVEEDARYRAAERRLLDGDYWNKLFRDAPVPPSLSGRAARPVSAHGHHRASRTLDAAAAARLAAAAAHWGVSWPDLAVAVLAAYLRRCTGAAEATLGVSFMGRLGSAAARTVATLVNVLPIRLHPDEAAPLATLATEAARQLTRARRHGRFREEQLRRDLGRVGTDRRLYGVLVNLLPFEEPLRFHGLDTRLEVLGTGPVDDLTVTLRGGAAGTPLRLDLDSNPNLYSEAETAAHADRFLHFLGAAIEAAEAEMRGGKGAPAGTVPGGGETGRSNPGVAHLQDDASGDLAGNSPGNSVVHGPVTPPVAPVPLAVLPLATPAEAAAQLARYEARDLPPDTLWDLLHRAVERTPEATAVRIGAQALSYATLDCRSAALAEALRARGVGRGDFVAVMLDRSLDLVVALLAVLRAGAAYLPLDPEHPRERTARILGTARPPVALASERDAALLGGTTLFAPESWPLRTRGKGAPAAASGTASAPATPSRPAPNDASAPIPDDASAPLSGAGSTPVPGASPALTPGASSTPVPGDAAYAIFTSGSTGEPKGVVVEHRAIVNRLEWMREHYGITAADRVLQKTPATFDVSVWEFFLPLISGATLVLAPPGAHRDPAALAAILRAERITACHFVPSMLAAFLREPAARGLRIPRVFCSGEELPAELRDGFHDTLSGELHNLYGPTEAAVDVSYWPAGAEDRSRPVPIGWPVWNTRLLVLDDAMRPLPPGVAGHLYLGGVQLARGYLHRPDLTADRFIPSPFHAGERLYRTGDLARLRHDGAVVFLGRSDHQVKIRGLRIELGEVEAVLARLPTVRQATVIAREDRPGDLRLVAYLVAAQGAGDGIGADRLRAALAATLPDYMIPSAFVVLDHLPVTANGKLDRAALPAPAAEPVGTRAPATEAERRMAALFAEVLELPAVGPDDDFFGLGGHSLLAVDLCLRIRELWGRDPGLGALFENPTPARLAAILGAVPGGGEAGDGARTAAWQAPLDGPAPSSSRMVEADGRVEPGRTALQPARGLNPGGRGSGGDGTGNGAEANNGRTDDATDAGPGNAGAINSGSTHSGPTDSGPINNGPINNGPINNGPINNGLGPILRLSAGSPRRAPLLAIHPAGGIGWCYGTLARALAPERATVALQAPALDPAVPLPESLDALADDYAERALQLRNEGQPVHLLGWSVGGIIAQAVAVRLRALGHRVGLLAMLDSYPADLWRDAPEPGPGAALGALMAIAGHPLEDHPEVPLERAAVLDFLRRSGSALGRLPAAALDGVARVVEGNNRLVRTHHHRRFDGTVTHLRAALDHADRPELVPDRWRPYAAALEVEPIPARHGELCGAAATALIAPILRRRLDAAERERG